MRHHPCYVYNAAPAFILVSDTGDLHLQSCVLVAAVQCSSHLHDAATEPACIWSAGSDQLSSERYTANLLLCVQSCWMCYVCQLRHARHSWWTLLWTACSASFHTASCLALCKASITAEKLPARLQGPERNSRTGMMTTWTLLHRVQCLHRCLADID